jgi:hypothetical protein
MFIRIALGALMLVAAVGLTQAKDKTVSGILTKVEPGSVEVRINKHATQSVVLTPDTTYEKYTIVARMALDRHADVHSLKIGMRVRIEVLPDNPNAAKKVWIVIT